MTTRVLRRLCALLLAQLLVVGMGFGIAHRAAPPVQAASLTASLVYDLGDSNLVAGELGPIDFKLLGTFEFYRGKHRDAWRCITDLTETGEDRNETLLPEPLAPRVRVDVRVSRTVRLEPRSDEGSPIYFGDYTVTVTLSVRGQDPQSRSGPVEPADVLSVTVGRGGTEREDIERIATVAADLLNELMGTFKPCGTKGTLKLQGGASLNGNPTHYAYEGTIDLSLDEAGVVDAEAPLTASIAMDPVPGCTRTFTVVNPRLRARGGYRAGDAALVIEELAIEQDAIVGTDDCTFRSGPCVWEERDRFEPVSGPCPAVSEGVIAFSLFGGRRARLAGELELAAPLGVMASLAIARPTIVHPNLTAWSATLDLAPDAPTVATVEALTAGAAR